MSYIGNPIISTDFPKDTFSGNGSTTEFTMSIAPASVNAVIVVVSGITQDPSTYTISGTTLTFSAAPPTGTSNISVRHLGVAGIPNTPSAGSVVASSIADGVITAAKFASGAITSAVLPVGTVLQVVSTTKTDTFSSSSTSLVDITGLSVSITPKSATSKILVSYNIMGGQDSGSSQYVFVQLVRNSTAISVGTSGGAFNATGQMYASNSADIVFRDSQTYLDSPATTSAVTYKLQGASWNSGITWYVNRRGTNSSFVLSSSITVMEIAA